MGMDVVAASATQYSASLFARLDTQKKGYLDAADLTGLTDSVEGADSTGAGAKALFSALDTDGDGRVTESELSSTLSSLADALLQDLRQHAPPQGADSGSSLISQIAANFDVYADAKRDSAEDTAPSDVQRPDGARFLSRLAALLDAYAPQDNLNAGTSGQLLASA